MVQFKVKEIVELKEVILAIKEYTSTPSLIILQGELGAGKTTLVRMFCEAHKVKESVSSPTYVLQHEYNGNNSNGSDIFIEHWDLYRVSEVPEELYEFPKENTIRFVEWGEKFDELQDLADLIISITVEEEHGEIYRNFKFHLIN